MKKMRTMSVIGFFTLIMLLLVSCDSYISNDDKSTAEHTQAWSEETSQNATVEDWFGETEEETHEETSEEFMAFPSWEESTEKLVEDVVEIRLPLDSVKEPIYTFLWGEASGQVGYSYEAMTGARGPQNFVVEAGVICVLDSVNYRVIMLEDGRMTEIDLGGKFFDVELIFQNQKIGVVDYRGDVVRIYQEDGTQEHYIDLPYAGKITELVEIGDNYVDWVIDTGNRYRCNWETKRLEKMGAWENDTVEVSAPVERNAVVVDGIDNTGVYYHYIDNTNFRRIICREDDGYRWITEVDLTGNRSYPLAPIYYSRDGGLYLMECFDEQVIISKLTME